MVEEKIKISKVNVLRFSLISGFFGIVSGLFSGIILFAFSRTIADSWGISNLPTGGLFFLAFLIVPLIYFILSFLFSAILILLLNLFLKLVKGLDIRIRKESPVTTTQESLKQIQYNQSQTNNIKKSIPSSQQLPS